jgi:hypothetical protein
LDLFQRKVRLPDFDVLIFKYSRVIQNCNKEEASMSPFIPTCNAASTNEVEKTRFLLKMDIPLNLGHRVSCFGLTM